MWDHVREEPFSAQVLADFERACNLVTPEGDIIALVLPEIGDLAELKTTLHIFWLLYRKKGYPGFVTYRELVSDPVLLSGLRGEGSPAELLRCSLEQAVSRGTLLHLTLEQEEQVEDLTNEYRGWQKGCGQNREW